MPLAIKHMGGRVAFFEDFTEQISERSKSQPNSSWSSLNHSRHTGFSQKLKFKECLTFILDALGLSIENLT